MPSTIHIQHLLSLTYKMYMWDLPYGLEEMEYKTDYYEGTQLLYGLKHICSPVCFDTVFLFHTKCLLSRLSKKQV
jgi:hypothetical protein